MLRLTVTTTIPSNNGKNVWFTFEIEEPDMIAVHKRLLADGCISGFKVVTEGNGDGPRKVVARHPYIIGKGGVATIAPGHVDYVEAV